MGTLPIQRGPLRRMLPLVHGFVGTERVYRSFTAADMGRNRSFQALSVPTGAEIAAAVGFSSDCHRKAEAYIDVMLETNKVMNLTAIRNKDEAMQRHVYDCLALLPVIDKYLGADSAGKKLRVIDVGSGAGLPGVVLAVARPQWQVVCLDSLRKRCDFVDRAAAECGIGNVRSLWSRAEEGGQAKEHREMYDLVVARAVADTRELSEYCLPFAKVGGFWVAAKGADCDEEVRGGDNAIRTLGGSLVAVERVDSWSPAGQRTAVVVRKDKACSPKYPRKPGTPKANPL